MRKEHYIINTDRTQPWNNLPNLPINRELYQNIEIYEKLGDAKASLAKLSGKCSSIRNKKIFSNIFSLLEAKYSCSIDNIIIPEQDLYQAFSDDENNIEESIKIICQQMSIVDGYNEISNGTITLDYFKNIYSKIQDEDDNIRPSSIDIRITQSGKGGKPPVVIYTPPKGDEIINAKLDNLIQYINEDSSIKLDPIIKSAIIHYQLEAIYPFRRLNERIGRTFCDNFISHKYELGFSGTLFSKFILNHKSQYYSSLIGVRQRGDWRSWLLFVIRAYEYSAKESYRILDYIINTIEYTLKKIESSNNNYKDSHRLVETIFSQPFTKVKHLVDDGIYAENTARNYLNRLVELNILEKRSILGHHYYRNSLLCNFIDS
jgi:Fic family protein